MAEKKVFIIGGGVAGLTAATELADLGVEVEIAEETAFAGGHAIQFTCKATDRCVKCGACVAEEKLERAVNSGRIDIHTGTRVRQVAAGDRFSLSLLKGPAFIDAHRCSDCGECLRTCPRPGAVLQGYSKNQRPFFAISEDRCLYLQDRSCTLCRDACPEGAIDLDAQPVEVSTEADAVILATGFTPFDPVDKPYGYGKFPNVVTHLEMERVLRRHGRPIRPSDGEPADRIAFIQCVGSRDRSRGHLWCSQVCCGSALRMANLIQARTPRSEITVFYMDIQTFGRDFDPFFASVREKLRMVRSIPADIYPAEADRLRVTFLDEGSAQTVQEMFDLVVLSVAIVPGKTSVETAGLLGLPLAESGFASRPGAAGRETAKGVFTAGAVTGPMSIAESVAGAGRTAWEVIAYLGRDRVEDGRRGGEAGSQMESQVKR